MAQIDIINTRLESYTEDVEDLKAQIKTMAQGKGVSIINGTDTPSTVLTKIDNATIAIPSGTLNITANDTYDVTNYSSAVVSVSGGLDPSDADAVAGDVLDGKTFYAGDSTKKTGTIQTYSGSTTISSNGTVSTNGKYMSSDLTVSVSPNLQNKTVTPTTSSQSIQKDSGYDGLDTVTVNAVTNSIDSNIQAGNIKNGVTILGVTGNYSGGSSAYTFQDYVSDNGKLEYLFYNSDVVNLQQIVDTLDSTGMTSLQYMFYGCKNTLSLVFPVTFDTSDVTDMKYLFYSCTSLATLDISHFDFSKVIDMSYMFAGCRGLTTCPIPANTDLYTVRTLQAMFQNAKGITTFDLSGMNLNPTAPATSMFSGCSGAISINLRNFSPTLSMSQYSSIFSGCTSLQTLDIRDWDMSNYTSAAIKNMFGTAYPYTKVPYSCTIYVGDSATATAISGVGYTNVIVV